jgi:hypothetical protein
LSLVGTAGAQDDVTARMSMERIGDIRPGSYSAGDQYTFTLNHYLDRYLLRFASDPEIYVLYADHGSLGGRILRYDSGSTALQVSGWGAITLYTDAEPSGVPAERTGDSVMPTVNQISLAQVQAAASDEAKHLAYARRVHLTFDANWPALAGDADMRAFAFDAMQNAARGIERFAARAAARAAVAARIDSVQLVTAGRPMLEMHGRTLNVAFNPEEGFAGRASSRGIARGLGQIFSVPVAN